MQIGILGAGSMGTGIAQVASQAGHSVIVVDNNAASLEKSKAKLEKVMAMLVGKGRISSDIASGILDRIQFSEAISDFKDCGLIIEAIIENLEIKKKVFKSIEETVSKDCILASNTSSLSISSIASVLDDPSRFLGIHFFNPAPLMKLVEIIPALQSSESTVAEARTLIDSWKKTTVIVKDTPAFIVNRVARPFYSEALRILEEGIADEATIDWAMTELGGFRMGPFTLMDFIGHDVNYVVTESVFKAFYYDGRYKPSFTQKRLVDAGWLGKKSGKGFYDYSDGANKPEPSKNPELGQHIVDRIVTMLINEAADALFLNIATATDIDLAMTKGVNYPKGLLSWADEIGIKEIVNRMDALHREYLEERYRCSPLLRRMARSGARFFEA